MTKKARINGEIRGVLQVRLLDKDGSILGIMSIDEAMMIAQRAAMDLVEIAPNSEPPVCKIMDYNKYKYDQEKKDAKAKKNQKTTILKEVGLRPSIAAGDFDRKLKDIKRFLLDGDKVKVSVALRGREIAHSHLAMQLAERIKEECAEISKIDIKPKLEGKQVLLIMSPLPKSEAKKCSKMSGDDLGGDKRDNPITKEIDKNA